MLKKFNFNPISPRKLWARINFQKVRSGIKTLIVRSYALLIFGLVLTAGYLSVHYLVLTVFFPPTMPKAMMDWAAKLDVSALRSTQREGVERAAPRAPISHYHSVDQWFQPDPKNGCTLSGCHEPLPHDSRAKVPAFANFHTTFLTCQMCHAPAAHRPAQADWVNNSTAMPQGLPAILQLLQYLELNSDAIASDPASVDPRIKDLLQQSISTLGQDAILDDLLANMQSAKPGSPVWKEAVMKLIGELPLHARGEYGAKLLWQTDTAQRLEQFNTLKDQAEQYQSAAPNSQVRHDLNLAIHKSLAPAATACVSCHDDQPGMLDFQAAGYSPKRTAFLSRLEIARLMQQIREGQHFYIPNLMEGGQ